MFPSILNIAEKYNLEIDTRTYGKKETFCKCPFCGSSRLSLNTTDDVFKCWSCRKAGGVLYFESLLSNQPFEVVREKYFGKRKKNIHPAYKLTANQLKTIGWQQVKRSSFSRFKESKEQVLNDWKKYKVEELIKHYALFLLIAHYPVKEKRREYYKWFLEVMKRSEIDDLKELIVSEYNNPKSVAWATRGEYLANIAYKSTIQSGDFSLQNVFVNVLLANEILKIRNNKDETREKISVSI